MRSILLTKTLQGSAGDEVVITEFDFHHLKNVVRLTEGENILLGDGAGLQAVCQLISLTKKELRVKIESIETCKRPFHIDLFVGLTKRESFDSLIGFATQLGLKKITPLETEFSQKRVLKDKRITQLVKSHLEQSNNAFIPNITDTYKIEDVDFSSYDFILVMDNSESEIALAKDILIKDKKIALVVGPEGGLSLNDKKVFTGRANAYKLQLPTPILRTEVAIVAGVGWILKNS